MIYKSAEMRYLLSATLFFAIPVLHAQIGNTYLDDELKICDKDDARYYRTYTKSTSGKYKEQTYFLGTNELHVLAYSTSADTSYYEGPYTQYYQNGKIDEEGTYTKNKRTGDWKHYYQDDGKLWYTTKRIAETKDIELKSYYKTGKLKREEIQRDGSDEVTGTCYSEKGSKIDFTRFRVMPRASYDIPAYLSENIRYPTEARRKDIEGRVLVKFTVYENGEVHDVVIRKHVSPDIDDEAMRVVSQMPDWTPGLVDDKPAKIWFTLPIQFRLE